MTSLDTKGKLKNHGSKRNLEKHMYFHHCEADVLALISIRSLRAVMANDSRYIYHYAMLRYIRYRYVMYIIMPIVVLPLFLGKKIVGFIQYRKDIHHRGLPGFIKNIQKTPCLNKQYVQWYWKSNKNTIHVIETQTAYAVYISWPHSTFKFVRRYMTYKHIAYILFIVISKLTHFQLNLGHSPI